MAHSTSFRLRVIVSSRSYRISLTSVKRTSSLLFNSTFQLETFGRTSSLQDLQGEMFTVQTIRVAVPLVIALLYDTCSGYPSIRQKQEIASHCKGCGDFCHECEYGVVISNVCETLQCAKGPDEPCGGPREVFGTCGEGMRCMCDQCTGCSSENLRCSKVQNPCLRDVNIFGRWPTIM